MALQTKIKTERMDKPEKLNLKFRGANERIRAQQEFKTDQIHIIKAGKKIYMQEFINANNEDAELIPTLQKYGTIERIEKQNPADLKYGEEDKNLTLTDAMKAMDKAKELWEELNHATRTFYHNDFREFLQNFEKDRKEAIQLRLDFEKKQRILAEDNKKQEKEVVNNGEQSGK